MHQLATDLRVALRRARKRPGLHHRRGALADARHRREHGDLQPRRRHPPAARADARTPERDRRDLSDTSPTSRTRRSRIRTTSTSGARPRSTFSQLSISLFTVAARDMGDHVETLMGELVNGDYFPLLGLHAGRWTTARSGGRRLAGRASGRRPLVRLLAARVRERSDPPSDARCACRARLHDRRRRADVVRGHR